MPVFWSVDRPATHHGAQERCKTRLCRAKTGRGRDEGHKSECRTSKQARVYRLFFLPFPPPLVPAQRAAHLRPGPVLRFIYIRVVSPPLNPSYRSLAWVPEGEEGAAAGARCIAPFLRCTAFVGPSCSAAQLIPSQAKRPYSMCIQMRCYGEPCLGWKRRMCCSWSSAVPLPTQWRCGRAEHCTQHSGSGPKQRTRRTTTSSSACSVMYTYSSVKRKNALRMQAQAFVIIERLVTQRQPDVCLERRRGGARGRLVYSL